MRVPTYEEASTDIVDSSVIYIGKKKNVLITISTFVTRAAYKIARLALLVTRQRRQSILPFELACNTRSEK